MEVVSMVHVHLQEHRGRPGFSRTDLSENALFVPDFWNVQPNLPHGAVVFRFDFEAVDPYSMRGQAVKLGPMPPSPLGGPRGFWDVEPARLSHMVNALYAKYDALNLGVVSWAYWHAVTATPHIAAVHFGAALESLQRAYFTSSSTPPIGTSWTSRLGRRSDLRWRLRLHRWGWLPRPSMSSRTRSGISTHDLNIPPARI